jgi:hypothetical protein
MGLLNVAVKCLPCHKISSILTYRIEILNYVGYHVSGYIHVSHKLHTHFLRERLRTFTVSNQNIMYCM